MRWVNGKSRSSLARRLPNARIVFSGGSGAIVPQRPMQRRGCLQALGVAKNRITLEYQSRNTYENAFFSVRIAYPIPGERWLLVTSAARMPRAIGCFRKVGFAVEAWPVEYSTPDEFNLRIFQLDFLNGLSRVEWYCAAAWIAGAGCVVLDSFGLRRSPESIQPKLPQQTGWNAVLIAMAGM